MLLVERGTKLTFVEKGRTWAWFVLAVGSGASLRVLQAMLDHSVDINLPDGNGRTALMWATQLDEVAHVRFLLDHHAMSRLKTHVATLLWTMPQNQGLISVFLQLKANHPHAASGRRPLTALPEVPPKIEKD